MTRILSGLLALCLCLALVDRAAATDSRRMVGEEEALEWRGVGRLNVAGRRFCTATLISETVAVTAAHCLHHPRTGVRIQLSEMRFVAGLRLGNFAAARRIVRAAIPDGYVHSSRADARTLHLDIALIELAQPIQRATAAAFPVGSPLAGYEALALVSYSRDRAFAPSIERPCRVRTSMARVAAIDCRVTYGASGSPVFVERAGRTKLSAVVSAMGRAPDGAPIALAVMAQPAIEALMDKLARTPASHAPPLRRPVSGR
jgi:V8-like Glu-specific endopeptidase